MEQVLVMNIGGLRTLDSQIGVFMDDTFFISEGCLEALMEMEKGLLSEDKNTRYFRRFCASYDIVRKSLLPLLLNLDDEVNSEIEDKHLVFYQTLKVLAQISQPLECLIPNLRVQLQTLDKYRRSDLLQQQVPHKLVELETLVKEIQAMLFRIKQAFTKPEPTTAILGRITRIISELPQGKLPKEVCEALDNVLFLYRNFLYLSDSPADFNSKMISLNTVILRLLFQYGIKDLVFYCINSPQYEHWTLSIIEFITLMYKDPERTLCGNYQPCLSASECSDSTVQEEHDSQYHSDPTLSAHSQADATVMDSSCKSVSSSMGAESGTTRSTESITTEVTIIIVREKLKEFSYELLRNGCAKLLYAVKTLLVSNRAQAHTSMYFMWNLSFYLMMAMRFNMPFACVRDLLSVYAVDYLVYTGVLNCERLLLAQRRKDDSTHIIKQMELAVTGIKYVFRCIDYYWKSSELSPEERQYLINIQVMLIQQSDVRHLLLLLLRLYAPATHQFSYLKCVIKLNHSFLTMTELLQAVDPRYAFFDMRAHICNFATQSVMRQYGSVLTHHRLCSAQTIEQVFTMMHHVATDCGRADTLLQLPILNAFCMIDEGPYRQTLSKECQELMEYSFAEFLKNAESDPVQCAKQVLSLQQQVAPTTTNSAGSGEPGTMWTQDELDELYQICMEHESHEDFTARVQHDLHARGIDKNINKDELQALGVDVTNRTDEMEDNDEYSLPHDIGKVDAATRALLDLGLDELDISELSSYHNKVAWYVHKLRATGHQHHLTWLQTLLLEACYIRLGGYGLSSAHPEEPVLLINTLLCKSLPIVLYTEDQEKFVRHKYCRGLMTELGLEPASQDEGVYPRIPHTWHVQTLVQKAEALGPVDYTKTKFSLHDVKSFCDKMSSITNLTPCDDGQFSQSTMADCESSMWMLYINKANAMA